MGPNPVPKRLITEPGAAGFVREFRRTSVDDSAINAAAGPEPWEFAVKMPGTLRVIWMGSGELVLPA
jgi:hypothetical protein